MSQVWVIVPSEEYTDLAKIAGTVSGVLWKYGLYMQKQN